MIMAGENFLLAGGVAMMEINASGMVMENICLNFFFKCHIQVGLVA